MRLRLALSAVSALLAIALAPSVGAAQDTDPTPPSGVTTAVITIEYLVSSGELNEGQANALLGKLEQIAGYLDAGDAKRAASAVAAFCNQVRAQVRAGHISALAGEGLIAAAEAALN